MITIQLRRDSSEMWVAKNPVLTYGEPGLEVDSGKFKIGNGRARWTALDYHSPDFIIQKMIENAVVNAQIGNPNSNFVMDYEAALTDILTETGTMTDSGDFIVNYESDLALLVQKVVDEYLSLSPSVQEVVDEHVNSETPHPVYDDGPSFELLYQNAKV